MTRCLIGLGSNLGDRTELLTLAERCLNESPDIRLIARSGIHVTSPVGGPPGQPFFLNAAITLETSRSADSLFTLLQAIEAEAGRQREVRWGARTLDLDLLLFGQEVIDQPCLQVPHPRMSFRRFVLAPAVEIAAEWRHPTIGWTLSELWRHLLSAPPIAIVVDEGIARAKELATQAAAAKPDWTVTLASSVKLVEQLSIFRLLIVIGDTAASAINQYGPGPLLVLRNVDNVTALAEIVAAMEASQA